MKIFIGHNSLVWWKNLLGQFISTQSGINDDIIKCIDHALKKSWFFFSVWQKFQYCCTVVKTAESKTCRSLFQQDLLLSRRDSWNSLRMRSKESSSCTPDIKQANKHNQKCQTDSIWTNEDSQLHVLCVKFDAPWSYSRCVRVSCWKMLEWACGIKLPAQPWALGLAWCRLPGSCKNTWTKKDEGCLIVS